MKYLKRAYFILMAIPVFIFCYCLLCYEILTGGCDNDVIDFWSKF